MRYAALLRGVNVGKSVRVPMVELKELIEHRGYANVVTYLNSGNVLFDSDEKRDEIAKKVRKTIADHYKQEIPVLLKSAAELINIALAIPSDWANDDEQKTDVAYLFAEADSIAILDMLPVRREYLDIRYTEGAVFWNVERNLYNKSQLNKLAGHQLYGQMTVRNINTARQLAKLAGIKA